jgi:hypothetical protein
MQDAGKEKKTPKKTETRKDQTNESNYSKWYRTVSSDLAFDFDLDSIRRMNPRK